MSHEPTSDRCSGCGLLIDGGEEACNAAFQELGGRSFTDIRFGGVHRMVVDTYALQHPARYCISAKSLAAHLCGLCELVERSGSPSLPNAALARWLNGTVALEKPDLPSARGRTNIADVISITQPEQFRQSVRAWADDVWTSYASLHSAARHWLDEALANSSKRSRHGRK